MPTYRSISGGSVENLFSELFSDTFGAEKALYSQYPFDEFGYIIVDEAHYALADTYQF